jgi:uncharacterized membrane protein (UPF0127 family)
MAIKFTKQVFITGIILLVLLILPFVFKKTQTAELVKNYPTPPPVLTPKQISVGQNQLGVYIANTDTTRQKGLGGIDSLPESEGMLFVFDSKNTSQVFWMKDMRFALDIIWIKDNRVIQIDKKVPAPQPNTPDSALRLYTPNTPIDYVLEVNAGYSDSHGIKIGDSVNLSGVGL